MFKMEISSRNVVEGTARAPHRAMYKAMGLSDDATLHLRWESKLQTYFAIT